MFERPVMSVSFVASANEYSPTETIVLASVIDWSAEHPRKR